MSTKKRQLKLRDDAGLVREEERLTNEIILKRANFRWAINDAIDSLKLVVNCGRKLIFPSERYLRTDNVTAQTVVVTDYRDRRELLHDE